MTINNTKKLVPATVDFFEQEEFETTANSELLEQEFVDVTDDRFASLSNIVECNTSLISRSYDPATFSRAVKAICNEYGLQEHDVEGPLLHLHVFGVNTRKLSTEAIIHLWDDHCFGDAANDFDFEDGFDAA